MTPPSEFQAEVIDRLARIESMAASNQESNERRFKTLEDHDARNLLIAAVFMGIAMVVKLG